MEKKASYRAKETIPLPKNIPEKGTVIVEPAAEASHPLSKEKALKIAVEIMREKIQRLAVQANLYDKFDLGTAGTKKASEERELLYRAIDILKRPEE